MPKDPVILLSYVNTELRDHYSSLDELCAALNADRAELEAALKKLDYEYNAELNKFV